MVRGQRYIYINIYVNGHLDSMTDPAQSVKYTRKKNYFILNIPIQEHIKYINHRKYTMQKIYNNKKVFQDNK